MIKGTHRTFLLRERIEIIKLSDNKEVASVLLGFAATGTEDDHSTPLNMKCGHMPGVYDGIKREELPKTD